MSKAVNTVADMVANTIKKTGEHVQGAYSGQGANGASKWINDAFGSVEFVGNLARNEGKKGVQGAFAKTFREGGVESGALKTGKIAMSYAGVAGAGRVLSGGGVYKDGHGNTNLAVVPFV